MPNPLRSARFVVPTLLAVAILLPVPAQAGSRTVAGTAKLRAAEARVLKDINRIRVRYGRKPLAIDARTSHVARARSVDMAARRYFAHTEPDGDDASRILDRRGVQATTVTENIGHTIGPKLKRASRQMAKWWYRSPPHRRQMLARDINYVGLGIARRGSRFTFTAIFTRSRDKDEPRVTIDKATVSDDGSRVTIRWSGKDRRLATGRTGIRRYDLQRLTPLGGWDHIGGTSRRSERTLSRLGHADDHLRVRAVDKAGNVGPWAYARARTVDAPSRLM